MFTVTRNRKHQQRESARTLPLTTDYSYKLSYSLQSKTIRKNSTDLVSTLKSSITKQKEMALIPSFFGNRRSSIFDPLSLDIWDPIEDFPFSGTFANFQGPARETSAFVSARIDWKETPEAHVFKADLPGLKKEEVKVEVEEGKVLQISGERSREQVEKNDKWHRVERSIGKFLRRFRLPENAKVDQIKAGMENGVLTVTVPKEEVKKPEVKAIDIAG